MVLLVHPQDLVDSLEEQLVATNGATAASSQQAVLASADAAMLKVRRGGAVRPTAAWGVKTARSLWIARLLAGETTRPGRQGQRQALCKTAAPLTATPRQRLGLSDCQT